MLGNFNCEKSLRWRALFIYLFVNRTIKAQVSKQGCYCKDIGTSLGNPGKETLQSLGKDLNRGFKCYQEAVRSSQHLAPRLHCSARLSLWWRVLYSFLQHPTLW